jgi:HEAT repeats
MSALVPRQITWDVLEKSCNPAAFSLLAAGLASPSVDVRMRCLKLLLNRPEVNARKTILLAWDNFSETEVDFIHRNTLHFQQAALDILNTGSLVEQRKVLGALSQLQLPGCLTAVLQIVIDPLHALQPLANDCLLAICIYWGKKARAEKDVPSIRGPILETVYFALLDYPKHKCYQVVDAWLALVHWDDSLQRGLISDPGHVAFRAVVDRLGAVHSNQEQNLQLLQLLAGYLLRSTTPKSIQSLVCEKEDPKLALELASIVDTPSWIPLKRRLRELPMLSSLKTLENGFPRCSLADKKRLWLLMSVSSKEYGQVLRGAVQIAKQGSAEGRLAAAEIVKNCRKPELDEMVADLQCALAGIAKPHSVGPALLEVVSWTQSLSVPLKQAAKELFAEFTVESLVAQVSVWPTSMCKAMAHVVSRIHSDVTGFLVKELESPAPKRRLAALRATQMLNQSETVSQYLLPMLEDPRIEVRVRVIDLLGELGYDLVERLLPSWLSDVNTDVQEAAKRVMRRRERLRKAESEPVAQAEGNAVM